MVSVPSRRQQAAYASQRGLSQRRARTLRQMARSTLLYTSKLASRDADVLATMRSLSANTHATHRNGALNGIFANNISRALRIR